MRLSAWIDAPVHDSGRASMGAAARDGWMTASVVSVDSGMLELVFEGAPEVAGTVVVPASGGVWAVGARVRVMVDFSGRVISVEPPVSVPEGAETVPVGVQARTVVDTASRTSVLEEWKPAITDSLVRLGSALETARGDLEAANAELGVRVDDAAAQAGAAQAAATGPVGLDRLTVGGGLSSVVAPEVWSMLAVHAKVTTDMLVAGNATITSGLIADVIEGKTIRGSSVTVTDGGAGIALRKGSSGRPEIVVETTDGGRAVLDTKGLTYWHNGKLIGSQSWRSLISPPFAVLTWEQDYGVNAPANVYWSLGASHAAASLYGGMAVDGAWLVVPVAGWYQVDVACGFRWPTTQAGWAVATSVWRESDHTAGRPPRDLEDPAATLPLIPSVTTRPVASGVMQLNAGEKIAPAFWQNTGSWKPNSGTSRMTVRLVDEL